MGFRQSRGNAVKKTAPDRDSAAARVEPIMRAMRRSCQAAFQPYGNCSGTEFCAAPDRIGDSTGDGFLGAAYAVLDPPPEGSVVRLPFIVGLAYLRADLRTDLSGDFPPEGGGVPAGMHENRDCSYSANADCADPGRVDEPLVYTGVTATVRPAHLSVTFVPSWKAAGAWALTAGFYLSF